MRQFRVQNGCLQPIHATIDPFHDVIALAAVPGECCHPLGQPIVIGHNAARIAVGAEVFTGVKRKRRGVSKGSNISPFVPGEMRLGAIF